MSEQNLTNFDSFSKLPKPLVPTSKEVMKFAGIYVKTDGSGRFDWASFKSAIDAYTGRDLTFDKFKSTTIAHNECTVKVMVDKIVKFLAEALSLALSAQAILELTTTIQTTFTTLKTNSSNGFLHFNESSDGHNSSWEYRIQFAFPNPDLPDHFYSLVTTIKLEANVSSKTEWWGLTSSSSKNFSATIDAMELVVQEGFKNPK